MLRAVCFFPRKKMGTRRGASLFLRGHSPANLARSVPLFAAGVQSRAHAAHSQRPYSLLLVLSQASWECAGYYVQQQGDSTALCRVSPSGRALSA